MGKKAKTKASKAVSGELLPSPKAPKSVSDSPRRGKKDGRRLATGGTHRLAGSVVPQASGLVPFGGAITDLPVIPLSAVAGRKTVDNSQSFFGAPRLILPPNNTDSTWSVYEFDAKRASRMSPMRLMEMLADLSPDVSRALWDYLRLCNPGWTCTVLTKKGGKPDPVGQRIVDKFLEQLTMLYGNVDVTIGRMFMSAFMRGALFSELVLDADGRSMKDLAMPDPASVRFERVVDSVRGPVWQLVQWQNRTTADPQAIAGYMPLNWPTIKYIPIDPFPGNPYGRSMAAPAVFSTLFLLGLLHDLRRVISQQGYPRLDISISMERLRASLPNQLVQDGEKYKAWVQNTIQEVEDAYSDLEPDDTYIHTDVITVNKPVGAVDSKSLGSIDGLIEAIERMSTRALKTMPFMMASTQTTTETLANREWEVQSAGVRSVQKNGAIMMQHLLTMGLQAAGRLAYVDWCFDELRQTQRLIDAQAEAIEIANQKQLYFLGSIDLDEASNNLVGHDATVDEPRVLDKGATPYDLTISDTAAQPRSDGKPRQRTKELVLEN